jgi:hypothetical protein
MSADIRTRRVALALLTVVALAALAPTGCSAEPTVAEEGQLSCIECHTDRDLLKADLDADPKPEKVVAESEGEG